METTREEREKWQRGTVRSIASLSGQANQWCRVPLKAQLSAATREAALIRDVDTLVEAAAKALDKSRTFRRVWQQRAPTDAEQMALRTVLKVKVEDPLDAVLGWPNP